MLGVCADKKTASKTAKAHSAIEICTTHAWVDSAIHANDPAIEKLTQHP
jgi:hypothetical protein